MAWTTGDRPCVSRGTRRAGLSPAQGLPAHLAGLIAREEPPAIIRRHTLSHVQPAAIPVKRSAKYPRRVRPMPVPQLAYTKLCSSRACTSVGKPVTNMVLMSSAIWPMWLEVSKELTL